VTGRAQGHIENTPEQVRAWTLGWEAGREQGRQEALEEAATQMDALAADRALPLAVRQAFTSAAAGLRDVGRRLAQKATP